MNWIEISTRHHFVYNWWIEGYVCSVPLTSVCLSFGSFGSFGPFISEIYFTKFLYQILLAFVSPSSVASVVKTIAQIFIFHFVRKLAFSNVWCTTVQNSGYPRLERGFATEEKNEEKEGKGDKEKKMDETVCQRDNLLSAFEWYR